MIYKLLSFRLILYIEYMSFKTGDRRHDFEVMCPFNSQHKMPYSRLPHHIS